MRNAEQRRDIEEQIKKQNEAENRSKGRLGRSNLSKEEKREFIEKAKTSMRSSNLAKFNALTEEEQWQRVMTKERNARHKTKIKGPEKSLPLVVGEWLQRRGDGNTGEDGDAEMKGPISSHASSRIAYSDAARAQEARELQERYAREGQSPPLPRHFPKTCS